MPDVISPATTARDYEDFGQLIRDYWDWLRMRYADAPGLMDSIGSHQGLDAELSTLATTYGPPRGRALLARRGDEVSGGVGMRDMGDGICEMKRLFVPDRFQGSGLGRQLCEALFAQAAADGYHLMRLDTGRQNTEAIAMYESMDFRRRSPYRDYPAELLEFLLFMEKPLVSS